MQVFQDHPLHYLSEDPNKSSDSEDLIFELNKSGSSDQHQTL